MYLLWKKGQVGRNEKGAQEGMVGIKEEGIHVVYGCKILAWKKRGNEGKRDR